jgi:hypothetical protein
MDTVSRDQLVTESTTQGPPHGAAHGVATDGGDRWRRVRVDPGAELTLGRGSMQPCIPCQ